MLPDFLAHPSSNNEMGSKAYTVAGGRDKMHRSVRKHKHYGHNRDVTDKDVVGRLSREDLFRMNM